MLYNLSNFQARIGQFRLGQVRLSFRCYMTYRILGQNWLVLGQVRFRQSTLDRLTPSVTDAGVATVRKILLFEDPERARKTFQCDVIPSGTSLRSQNFRLVTVSITSRFFRGIFGGELAVVRTNRCPSIDQSKNFSKIHFFSKLTFSPGRLTKIEGWSGKKRTNLTLICARLDHVTGIANRYWSSQIRRTKRIKGWSGKKQTNLTVICVGLDHVTTREDEFLLVEPNQTETRL